jgi:hypothetical protein
MAPQAELLIAEGDYPPRIDESDVARGAAANDVNMLVCTGAGSSEAEFRSLSKRWQVQPYQDNCDSGAS